MGNVLIERLWLYRIRSKKDASSFAAVYDRYVAQIYRFILFKVGSEEDAKEITSDVFMKVWEYVIAGKPVSNLTGLLYTVARTSTVDHYRKKKLDLVSLNEVPDIADLKLTTNALAASADLEAVLTAVRALKDEYREVLLMRHVDGLSMREIAAALQKNSGTVRVLLHRATNALREIIK